ncbi:hypothetical protein V8B55DRAFT_1485656 [Mucor lusitanicus]|uniref:WRKY domain-containing protein n=2 Tax=Mucor circinelloides f. lusitanicus TaxID=29924 RepID=A0A8H4EWI3_MUCCL|nr:hypothetical protein FB192DRAFT_1462745 [Mucor lusitanicus]
MLTSNSLLLSSSSTTSSAYPPSPPMSSSSKSIPNGFLNLEKVVSTYGNQPELLELILSSKVEEDRRRAEEAKLRRKEIDFMLQKQQQQQQQQPSPQKTLLPPISQHRVNSLSSTTSNGSNDSTLPRLQQYHHSHSAASPWKNSEFNSSVKRRNSSSIEMLLSPSPNPSDLKLPELSLTPSSSSSTIRNINQLHYPPILSNTKRSRSISSYDEDQEYSAAGSAPPSPPIEPAAASSATTTKRRRREMQAISTIIETKEFPYNDDYLWKNNGNTVHKKTGFKSIYYKCSNSAKGCPVNKTVTFKDNGEHLIKYRAQHLPECNRIKRITDL